MALDMKQVRVDITPEIQKLMDTSRQGSALASVDILLDGTERFVYKAPWLLDDGTKVHSMFIQKGTEWQDVVTLTIGDV